MVRAVRRRRRELNMLRALSEPEISIVAERLARHGRAQVPDVLQTDDSRRLRVAADDVDYAVVTTGERGHIDLPAVYLDSLDTGRKRALGQLVQSKATTRFQYLFDNHPIYDMAQAGTAAPVWRDLVAFLNGDEFLGLMRRLTGEPRIAMADAQLTRFRPGHFLTRHDDHTEGKSRFYAYVLSLTPEWDADWGGLLAFHGSDGNVEEAFTPRFNTLNLLKTPQPHSVTQVALFAGAHRISVTGWLRGV